MTDTLSRFRQLILSVDHKPDEVKEILTLPDEYQKQLFPTEDTLLRLWEIYDPVTSPYSSASITSIAGYKEILDRQKKILFEAQLSISFLVSFYLKGALGRQKFTNYFTEFLRAKADEVMSVHVLDRWANEDIQAEIKLIGRYLICEGMEICKLHPQANTDSFWESRSEELAELPNLIFSEDFFKFVSNELTPGKA